MTERPRADDIDFSRIVRPGDTVIWTHGAGEPTTLVEKLLEQRHRCAPFTVFLGTSYTGVVRPEHADVIRFVGIGAVGSNRALSKAGAMEIIPCHLSEVPRLIADGPLRADIVLMQVSSHEADGGLSLSTTNLYIEAALPNARTLLAELNDQAPWTGGRNPVRRESVDLLIHTSRALPEVSTRPPNAGEQLIARHVAALIPDRATLQIGIGSAPNALFACLKDHRDLGLHTGVVGDGLVDLVHSGVLTNAAKSIDTGCTVTGSLVGTRRLYDFAHRNSSLRVEPVSYTHAPEVLARLERLIAVNSAIEVDITGQVGAEVAGRAYVGTVGGQTDFVRAARASPGGRSIIALPARSESGVPRVVPRIRSGAITTARADADVVVTEYGVAELRGRSIRERAHRMIAIAHPVDREPLQRAAHQELAGY